MWWEGGGGQITGKLSLKDISECSVCWGQVESTSSCFWLRSFTTPHSNSSFQCKRSSAWPAPTSSRSSPPSPWAPWPPMAPSKEVGFVGINFFFYGITFALYITARHIVSLQQQNIGRLFLKLLSPFGLFATILSIKGGGFWWRKSGIAFALCIT